MFRNFEPCSLRVLDLTSDNDGLLIVREESDELEVLIPGREGMIKIASLISEMMVAHDYDDKKAYNIRLSMHQDGDVQRWSADLDPVSYERRKQFETLMEDFYGQV